MQESNQLKKIVFVNQATGYLTIDIINEFANKYDEVALISGSIRVQDIPINKCVKHSKIITYNRGNPFKKFSSWLIGTIQIFFLLITKYRKYEIFYITIPPLAYLISNFITNKFCVLIFDVYPDVLKIYNIKENSFIYKLWVKLNKKNFIKAHRVYTIGEGMAKLIDKYMDRKNLVIIPNWSGLTKLKVVEKENNPWLIKHNFGNKFIVQYSGNIGYTHNVEVVVELANSFQNNTDIVFLIIGRGEKVKLIQNLITKYNLNNCFLLPFQPDDELNYSLSAADLGVVLLDDKTAHVSIPSKIYNLQAVAVPLLGIAKLNSELNKHILHYKNGKCFNQSSIMEIRDFIIEMKNNPSELKKLSNNSLTASIDFTNKNANKYYSKYVQ
jgi:hypothetical protein